MGMSVSSANQGPNSPTTFRRDRPGMGRSRDSQSPLERGHLELNQLTSHSESESIEVTRFLELGEIIFRTTTELSIVSHGTPRDYCEGFWYGVLGGIEKMFVYLELPFKPEWLLDLTLVRADQLVTTSEIERIHRFVLD
jgi:hypothetical protein